MIFLFKYISVTLFIDDPAAEAPFDVHAEEKLWSQMKYAVDNVNDLAGTGRDLHLYMMTTQSPDYGRDDNRPSCLEDGIEFTRKYLLGNPNPHPAEDKFSLKVGFYRWFRPGHAEAHFCRFVEEKKNEYIRRYSEGLDVPDYHNLQMLNKLEYTKFFCSNDKTYERCNMLEIRESHLNPRQC